MRRLRDAWIYGSCLGLAIVISVSATISGLSAVLNLDGFYQDSSSVTSTSAPNATPCLEGDGHRHCYIVFKPVPAGKKLIVTQASCELNASNGAEVTRLYLAPMRGAKFIERFQFLASSTRPGSKAGVNIVVNSGTYQPFDEKERPIVYIEFTIDSGVNGFCSIAGQLSDKGS